MQEQRLSPKESFSWSLPVVVRPELNTGQTEPAERGSSDNGFVFVIQPKIIAPPRVAAGTIGPRAYWPPDDHVHFARSLCTLEKWYEQSRDLSGSRGNCAPHVRGFGCAAFGRCIGRSAEQRSKCSHGLRRVRPLLARTQ
jgi:hypothetical protein